MAQYNNSRNNVDYNSPVTSTAVSYAALLSDSIIAVTDTTASRTITLPAPSVAAATVNVGKYFIIKDQSGAAGGAFPIIVAPASGTIDGAASINIDSDYGMMHVYSDGVSWFSSHRDSQGSFMWSAQAAGTALAPASGYLSTAATAQSFALPATASVGSVMELSQVGAGIVTITQAAGQSIVFGNATSTAGTGGSIASTAAGDGVKLVCTVADTTFQVVTGSVGNWSIV